MPLRSAAPPVAFRLLRSFHSSAILRVDSNHYDTLQVAQNASPKEIKKSFYNLSKTHHPDHNPDDPEASSRFMKISEAYTILGNSEKRRQYDKDTLRTISQSTSVPKGSYSSSGPVGGRPASGLSRRRTHFQGPPPSFYRSGGWGNQGTKRKAAQGTAESGNFTSGNGPQGHSGGSMGYGQHPFGPSNDVPHFDREGHLRTHSNHERRRRSRHMQSEIPVEQGSGMFANFIFIGGILVFCVVMPGMIYERVTRKSEQDR